MALIKCPECGRENVSDTAEMCPSCGYGIKAYCVEKQKKELDKKIYETKLKNVPKPTKPKFNSFQVVIMTLPGVIGFIFGPAGGIIGIIACLIIAYNTTSNEYNEAMKKYDLAQKDFERYQKEEVIRQERRAAEEAAKPKCPHCNSTNIEKISTTSRAVSVATVGLASNKIGKQYKCKNCKHMW